MSETASTNVLQNGMRPEVAKRRIASFAKLGSAHLYLAYHAAFPLALTSDLLYRLWANFPRDIHGKHLNIPWVAVADLLLSSICEEVGYELYEMNMTVRTMLLNDLKADANLGDWRINELSNFLLAYVKQQLSSHDPSNRTFAKAQQWTALAYTRPSDAARELALALRSSLVLSDRAEQVRVASLLETFAEPLAGFAPLLAYARGMRYLAYGDVKNARAQFSMMKEMEQIELVPGVSLPIPEWIRQESEEEPTQSHFVHSVTAQVKLFILGLPGSGKSTMARHIIDYVGKQKSDCHTVRINDYDILYAMYKADTEGKFRPAGRDGFDVLELPMFDSALKTVEQEANRAGQVTNNHAQATFKPMLILIEFARDDYSHALQQFPPGFLQGAYFLFLDASIEICKARIRERIAHPHTKDDHEVSDYIFDSYYDKDSAHALSANVTADHGIEQQHVKVLDNNGAFDDIRDEVESFVDVIVKHLSSARFARQ